MVTNKEAVRIIRSRYQERVGDTLDKFHATLRCELEEHQNNSFDEFSVYETPLGDLALFLKWPNVLLNDLEDECCDIYFDIFLCADGGIYWRCSGEQPYSELDRDVSEDVVWGSLEDCTFIYLNHGDSYDNSRGRIVANLEVDGTSLLDPNTFRLYLSDLSAEQ